MTGAKSAASYDAVKKLARSIELTDIRPIAFLARLVAEPPARGAKFDVDIRPRLTWHRAGTTFTVVAHFSLRAVREGEKDRPFVLVSYRVAAYYRWNDGSDPSEETLRDFAESNAMVNLWPYFRTFVTNSWAQLGLEPFVLPVFRVKSASPPDDAEGAPSRRKRTPDHHR